MISASDGMKKHPVVTSISTYSHYFLAPIAGKSTAEIKLTLQAVAKYILAIQLIENGLEWVGPRLVFKRETSDSPLVKPRWHHLSVS